MNELAKQFPKNSGLLRTGTVRALLKTLADIARVVLTTHESAIRIIDKKGLLHNPADRDHCLQ